MSGFEFPGKCSFADIAAMVGRSPQHVRYDLQDPACPQPKSLGRWGGAHVFDEFEAREWATAFLAFKATAPERAAERRAEAQRRQEAEQAAEAERQRILKHMGDCAQATQDSLLEQIDEMNRTGAYRL